MDKVKLREMLQKELNELVGPLTAKRYAAGIRMASRLLRSGHDFDPRALANSLDEIADKLDRSAER